MWVYNRLLVLCIVVVVVVLAAAAEDNNTTTTSSVHALKQWLLHHPQGYFSPRVEFRPIFDDNNTTIVTTYGLFAVQDLQEEEVFMAIPSDLLVYARNVDDDEEYDTNECHTAAWLALEYMQHSDITTNNYKSSPWAPYLEYLFDGTKENLLPATWSATAQDLFGQLLGQRLFGNQDSKALRNYSYRQTCKDDTIDIDDEDNEWIYNHALRMVLSRGWDDKMIPVLDMINHRNGRYKNVEASSPHENEKEVEGYATRPIQAGEQLYFTYNDCEDVSCDGVRDAAGTLYILQDYGFVEDYPQRWAFFEESDDGQDEIWFELDCLEEEQDEHDSSTANTTTTTTTWQLTWWSHPTWSTDQLQVLMDEYHRLQEIKVPTTEVSLSPHEGHTLQALQTSLLKAIGGAILCRNPVLLDADESSTNMIRSTFAGDRLVCTIADDLLLLESHSHHDDESMEEEEYDSEETQEEEEEEDDDDQVEECYVDDNEEECQEDAGSPEVSSDTCVTEEEIILNE